MDWMGLLVQYQVNNHLSLRLGTPKKEAKRSIVIHDCHTTMLDIIESMIHSMIDSCDHHFTIILYITKGSHIILGVFS